jgi:hypothetical protein
MKTPFFDSTDLNHLALGDKIKIIIFSPNSIYSTPGQHRLDGSLAIGAVASILPAQQLITAQLKLNL